MNRHWKLMLSVLVVFVTAVVIPSVAQASDFSGLAYIALAIIGGVALAGLFAGHMTTLLVIGLARGLKSRHEALGYTLVFAAIWCAVGWIVSS